MRSLIIFCCIVISSAMIFAQEDYYDPEEAKSLDLSKDQNNIQEKKINYHLSTGAFVSSGSNYGSYIMPDIGYKVSEKFNVRAGLLLINSGNFNLNDAENYSTAAYNGTFMFLRGDYQLNEKILIHGAVFKDLNTFGDFSSEGYSVGFEYSIGERSSIGVEFQFNRGNNPFYHPSPFNPYNSFGNQMFNY